MDLCTLLVFASEWKNEERRTAKLLIPQE